MASIGAVRAEVSFSTKRYATGTQVASNSARTPNRSIPALLVPNVASITISFISFDNSLVDTEIYMAKARILELVMVLCL